MAFFLIVPSIMAVSIVLVHALTKRLGLQIHYPTLAAVAVLSIMADFAATLIMPAGGKAFLLRLGIIVFAASLMLTFANRFLVNKQREEEQRFTDEVKAAYAAEVQNDIQVATNADNSREDIIADESPPPPQRYNEFFVVEYDAPATDAETVKSDDKSVADADVAKSDEKPAVDAEVTKSDDKPVADADVAKPDETPAVDAEVAKPDDKPVADADVAKSAEDEILKASEIKNFDAEVSDSDDVTTADSGLAEPEEITEFDVKVSKSGAETDPVIDLEVNKLLSEKKSDAEIAELLDGGVFEPLPEFKPEEADKPIETKDEPEEKFPLDEVFKPLSEVKPEVPEQPEKSSEPEETIRTEFFPLQEVFKPLSMLRLDKIEEMTAEEKTAAAESPKEETEPQDEELAGTLDDILDKAYGERMKGHVWQAIDLYQTALERYRNDEYAPFVAIDLGNIYKEEALYSKAVKIYESALTLPAVKRNPEIRKEFSTNLEYLRVVRDVLLKHHEMSTPFGKLPKDILQEIDREFQKTTRHAPRSSRR